MSLEASMALSKTTVESHVGDSSSSGQTKLATEGGPTVSTVSEPCGWQQEFLGFTEQVGHVAC